MRTKATGCAELCSELQTKYFCENRFFVVAKFNFCKILNFQLDNFVDVEKCCKMRIWLLKSVLIQPRTSRSKRVQCRGRRSRHPVGGFLHRGEPADARLAPRPRFLRSICIDLFFEARIKYDQIFISEDKQSLEKNGNMIWKSTFPIDGGMRKFVILDVEWFFVSDR